MTLTIHQQQDMQVMVACLNYLYREAAKSDLQPVSAILARALYDLNHWLSESDNRQDREILAEMLDSDFLRILDFFQTFAESTPDARAEFCHYLRNLAANSSAENPQESAEMDYFPKRAVRH